MWKHCVAGMALALSICASANGQESYDTRARKYIEQYKEMAMSEQKRTGIPAAITLAQGIHETSAGISPLAVEANNHFGIKCKKNWQGETYTYTDDAPDECFRKYASPAESYKDHSDYLSHTPRYASLFKLSSTDYASWAIGLRQAGYATNPRYAQVLIRLIEDYHLQEYTYAALDKGIIEKPAGEVVPEQDANTAEEPWARKTQKGNIQVEETSAKVQEPAVVEQAAFPPYGQVVKVNGLKAIYAKKGDMPLEYAISQNIRYERLLEINEISDKPLPEDMYLYLERKRFKGLRPTHTVKAGETLAKAAQYEGVQSKYLRSLNGLDDNEEPAEGTTLYLQDNAPSKPAVALVPAVAHTGPAVFATVEPQPVTTEAAATPATELINTSAPAQEPQVQFADQKTTAPAENTIATEAVEPSLSPEPTAQAEPLAAATPDPTAILPPAPPDVPAPAKAPDPGPVTVAPPYNIASEKPVEELIKEEKAKASQDEPKDELDALKAKFDKVVYAQPPAKTPPPPAAEPVATRDTIIMRVTEPANMPAAAAHPADDRGPKFYTVKKGDTAFNIAKRNNISVRELMEWNKLDFEGIRIGQKLRIKP